MKQHEYPTVPATVRRYLRDVRHCTRRLYRDLCELAAVRIIEASKQRWIRRLLVPGALIFIAASLYNLVLNAIPLYFEATSAGESAGKTALSSVPWVQLLPHAVPFLIIALAYILFLLLRRAVTSHGIHVRRMEKISRRISNRVNTDMKEHFLSVPLHKNDLNSLPCLTIGGSRFGLRMAKNMFDCNMFSLINREAFRGGAYSYPIGRLIRRNRDIYEVNPLSSAFIVDCQDSDMPIGISHVFPLTPTPAISTCPVRCRTPTSKRATSARSASRGGICCCSRSACSRTTGPGAI